MNKFEDARSTGQKEENIMGKYEQDARQLLEYVGGKENIAAVSHCVSRMRFVLNDPAKADVAKIEALKSAKGTFTQAGQFQVIIGNTVSDFYNDFIAVSGIDGVSKDAVKSAAKQNQNALQKVMSVLAEIFAPLIPAIITGGLILGFRNCIDSIYFFENGTKTLCNISQFWSGVDSFLWLIGEAIFHMLPVCICWSVTKKMGTTQSLGIVLGLTLVSGQLLNAYAVASTAAADIPKWDFGFFTINMIGYQAQVIPAMLAAFTLVYLEKFFRKICPPVISMIVVPFCSLVLSVIVAHTILGPIGWKIGTFISDIVYAGISGSFRVVFGAIFGFVYAPLVITGLHHMSNAIDMQLIAEAYWVMKKLLDLTNEEMADVFARWNEGKLRSYLIEITANILRHKDKSGGYLIDKILDAAGQKGTGKWTVINAMELGMPLGLIATAVFERSLSSQKDLRHLASKQFQCQHTQPIYNKAELVKNIFSALYASKLVSYAQGFAVLQRASDAFGWHLDLASIARMWRGGCIIRSIFLNDIAAAFEATDKPKHLLLAPYFKEEMKTLLPGWKNLVAEAMKEELPVPAFSSALNYFYSLTSADLPANLVQAQRDYFGAHTFERKDELRGQFFHENWTGHGGDTKSGTYNV